MYRLILLFYGLSLFQFLSAQDLVCPPNKTQFCHDPIDDRPQIIDGSGLELVNEREFIGNTCQISRVMNTFRLVDADGGTVSSCTQELIIEPLESTVLFPKDTIVYGMNVSEVHYESVLTEGLFPLGTNDCNIRYTFDDVIVEAYPELYIFRHWEAYNFCTDETTIARQRILLLDLPNNSIATQVEDCGGRAINVDSIEIRINGELVDRSFCFSPFDNLHETLNCMADSLLQAPSDTMTLTLRDITNPLKGLGILDLIDIRRHILGLKRFETECRVEAADVNRDGLINGIDLVETRKMILGIYTRWPDGNGPSIYVNGDQRDNLTFTREDFPLPSLNIMVVNRGNVSTN